MSEIQQKISEVDALINALDIARDEWNAQAHACAGGLKVIIERGWLPPFAAGIVADMLKEYETTKANVDVALERARAAREADLAEKAAIAAVAKAGL